MERSARVVSSVLEIEPPALIPQVRAALAELVEARVLADDVGKDVWQYAIGLARFDKLDIRERHLRWLIDKSYAQHALDTTRKGDHERKFTPLPDDHLPPGACLVITDRGLTLAGKSFQAQARALAEPIQLPHWAADRRKLIFGRAVVLELSRSAPNLECVLAEFERRDWPSTIGDPFLPDPEGGALQRVRDTVYALNQRRSARLIEFFSQTSGPRIGWQVSDEQNA